MPNRVSFAIQRAIGTGEAEIIRARKFSHISRAYIHCFKTSVYWPLIQATPVADHSGHQPIIAGQRELTGYEG